MFILILFSFFLQSQDIIKYPEKLPINNKEVIEHLKHKEQPQLLEDEYWDDDRILFSTYFGGSGYDCINDGAFDSQGNFIQVGYTGSPDLPIVGDAFQKEKNLNHDMFIVKWNPEGDVIWSTFLGGSGADVLYSVAIDINDDIIVAGRTESTDIIVSEDASQKDNIGGSDFYLAKFTTDGEYIWSTYWGGVREEMQCRMVIDEVGNIYLGGTTSSTGKSSIENIILPTDENAIYKDIEKPRTDDITYSTTYISKFTSKGKYLWGTYFGNTGDVSEVLTGLDVFGNEVAFSWDLWGYRATKDGNHIFAIVTDDAEQKEGITIEGQWHNTDWQAQVFKIDTAGTTLKYGTFYSGDYSSSKKIKYDKIGNLYCLIGTERLKSRKDSLFGFKDKNGNITFVKYNRKNELEWDFGYSCFEGWGSIYDFDIDENNVLWTAGSISCNELEQSVNPFPSKWGPEGGSGFIFVLDLIRYKYWSSYEDIGLTNRYSVKVSKNQISVSGCHRIGRSKKAFQSDSKNKEILSGAFFKLNMKNLFHYNDTSSIDTTKKNYEYNYYLDIDKLIITSKDSVNNIKLVDLNGKLLFEEKFFTNKIEINKTKYSIGVYFVIINEKKVLKCLIY